MAAWYDVREKRDMRDPSLLGNALLNLPKRVRTLARRYDRHRVEMRMVPKFVDAQTSLEKYGDPRERGDAWVEANA